MFDANGGRGGVDDGVAEDTRLYGYDPVIPPALIQEELPAVTTPLLGELPWINYTLCADVLTLCVYSLQSL